jgi:hypothetical protein
MIYYMHATARSKDVGAAFSKLEILGSRHEDEVADKQDLSWGSLGAK